MWLKEILNASTVCPESVLPLASVIVPLNITGILVFFSFLISSMAYKAALAFKVSKIVSTKRMSAPPSIKPVTCSL